MANLKKKIEFYNSFEEADEAKYAAIVAQDPRTRLKETVELIRKVYANHPKPDKVEKKLYFP